MNKVFTKGIFLIAAIIALGTLDAQTIAPAKSSAAPHNGKIHFDEISLNTRVSGDGFGMQYVTAIGIRFGKRSIVSGGPMFASEDWKSTGYTVGFRYLMMDEGESENGRMRLSFTTAYEQFKNQSLSDGTIRIEKRAARSSQPEETMAFEKMRFSGWEFAMGFGMSYQCRVGLFFRTEAGAAYYNSANGTTANAPTIRENHATCLKLGAGVGWKF